MTATLRDRAEHAARYSANLVVPATEIKQLLDDLDEYDPILTRTGEILTAVAEALNGPPPPLTSWSHHDLAEKAAKVVAESRALRRQLEAVREVHQPLDALHMDTNRVRQVCTGCGTDAGNYQLWPCPTIRGIDRAALAEETPR